MPVLTFAQRIEKARKYGTGKVSLLLNGSRIHHWLRDQGFPYMISRTAKNIAIGIDDGEKIQRQMGLEVARTVRDARQNALTIAQAMKDNPQLRESLIGWERASTDKEREEKKQDRQKDLRRVLTVATLTGATLAAVRRATANSDIIDQIEVQQDMAGDYSPTPGTREYEEGAGPEVTLSPWQRFLASRREAAAATAANRPAYPLQYRPTTQQQMMAMQQQSQYYRPPQMQQQQFNQYRYGSFQPQLQRYYQPQAQYYRPPMPTQYQRPAPQWSVPTQFYRPPVQQWQPTMTAGF